MFQIVFFAKSSSFEKLLENDAPDKAFPGVRRLAPRDSIWVRCMFPILTKSHKKSPGRPKTSVCLKLTKSEAKNKKLFMIGEKSQKVHDGHQKFEFSSASRPKNRLVWLAGALFKTCFQK